MKRIYFAAICLVLAVTLLGSMPLQSASMLAAIGPYAVGTVTVSTTNPINGDVLSTTLYFPANNGAIIASGAPYSGWVLARGYQSDPNDYAGVAENLASYGAIVAVPNLPTENVEARASDVRYLFSYLESENARTNSMFFQKVATTRFGSVGHSLGGTTAMMVAARDSRIKSTIALDPVYPPALLNVGTWDFQTEAPQITAPLIIIGAPANRCNNSANYNDVYPLVGSEHKAKFVVNNANHCDFLDTNDLLRRAACYLFCGGQFDAARVQQIEKYSAAWFDYYLNLHPDNYSQLYGAQIQQDIQAGVVSATVQTAPRNFQATGEWNRLQLNWSLSIYPVITGYNIYRSTASGSYSTVPYAQTGRQSVYYDNNVVAGQRYYYILRSRDGLGNEHQSSPEISATVLLPGQEVILYLPYLIR